MQLSSFTGNSFVLGHAAMLINESMPEFIVREVERNVSLRGKTVAILGMAFKAESDDVRASLSYKLRKLFWFTGARVLCTDPYVDAPDFVDLSTAVSDADVIIIGAPHEVYRGLDLDRKIVVDVWGHVEPGKIALG